MADGKILPLRAQVHPTALVSPQAQLGVGVEVGPYAVIGPDVAIGDQTVIGPHVVITGATRLGQRNRIYAGALIGVESADRPEVPGDIPGGVRIGDDNVIREYACIQVDRVPPPAFGGTSSPAQAGQDAPLTRIGNGNFIMAYVQVGPGCRIGNGVVITHATALGAGVWVEDNVVISGLSSIAPGVRIGQLAMVGAVTLIQADVPPFLMVAGNPPQVHGINVVGLRRHGVSPEERTKLKRAFRLLYRASRPLPDSIQELQQEFAESALVRHLIQFLQESEHGIFQPPTPMLEFPEGHEQ
ncbi:MAG: acyl-ACP--UDP-N-acetylglucosamine O-acyltransferase [Limnochordaceae bacterium]|nr:acyl-ACP--UDP-N-acetylglucosamine O-acyltransferase [Limnochordaceae bacterium]